MDWFSVGWRVLLLLIMLRLAFGKWGGLVSVTLNTHLHPTEYCDCDCDDDDGDDDTAEYVPPPKPDYCYPCPSQN